MENRGKGLYKCKIPKLGAKHTKQQASKDITKYCKEDNSYFSINYVYNEYLVLKMKEVYNQEYILI